MIRQFSMFLLISAITCAGCQTTRTISSGKEVTQKSPDVVKLRTHLRTSATVISKDSVKLFFTVINEADTVQQFCKWETPFEPQLGKYMEVTDVQDNEVAFKGAVARRVMPPPPGSYIPVPAHDSVTTVFNLAKNYSIKPGQYKAKYIGGGVSGLESSNEIKITITDH